MLACRWLIHRLLRQICDGFLEGWRRENPMNEKRVVTVSEIKLASRGALRLTKTVSYQR
jgi:hypothetical protein